MLLPQKIVSRGVVVHEGSAQQNAQISSLAMVTIVVAGVVLCAELAACFMTTLIPQLKVAFTTTDQWLEMCVAVGLVALGLSGLFYGLTSDAFGRRPLFIGSMVVFSFATWLMATTVSPAMFLFARITQCVGAGAAWVVGNAILNDVLVGKAYLRAMNHVHAVAGLVPAIAPIWATYWTMQWGWRSCYEFLLVFALVFLVLMLRYQRETLPVKMSLRDITPVANIAELVGLPHFGRFMMIKVISVAMFYAEASQIPLLLVDYHGVPFDFLGFYLLPLFLAYILGSSFNHKLLKWISLEQVIGLGLVAIVFGSLATILLEYSLPLWGLIALRSLCYLGRGFIFGNATALIVSASPKHAGLASALMICLEMLFSSLAVYVMAFAIDGSFMPMSAFLVVSSLMCALPILAHRPFFARG